MSEGGNEKHKKLEGKGKKRTRGEHEHFSHGGVDGGILYFDGYDRVETADGGFEGNKGRVLIREDAKVAVLDAEGYTTAGDVFGWHEPIVALCLLV